MSREANLWQAIAEETKNREMFLAFAEKADAEGRPQVARLFRAVAESELVHARAELRLLSQVKSTVENVRWAIGTEEREFQEVYARFLREAKAEGNDELAELLTRVMEVERGHYKLFTEAMESLLDGRDAPRAPVLICTACGHTVLGAAPQPCPVCGSAAEQFRQVD